MHNHTLKMIRPGGMMWKTRKGHHNAVKDMA